VLIKEHLKRIITEKILTYVNLIGDLMSKQSKTISDTMEDTKDRHRRYLRAIQHPLRRDILRAMEKGASSMEELENETGLDANTLSWHLKTLEHGFCIERKEEGESTFFVLTQEGRVVDYLD
jgi:predicted transcriptional regulator